MNGHIAHRRILHPDIPSKPSRIPYIEIMHIGLLAAATLSATTLLGQPAPSWRDQGILYLKNSPHAKLRNIPVHAVTITNGFWADRRKVNVEKSIPTMRDLLESNGRMDNFLRLTGKKNVPQRGPVYSDSDVYKWLEAVGFALQSENLPALRKSAEDVIGLVVAAQEPSGYLNTYFVGERAAQRLLPATLEYGHELYDLGHMIQGAIAYYRATGDRKLLDAAERYVDLLLRDYGPGKKPVLDGHPEIEMSLIELYRLTGNRGQLDLAGYMLHGDERIQLRPQRIVYQFNGKPFTSRTKFEGHAVRAMYASCGATDYYMETGDRAYWNTLETLWRDLVTSKMYITGGVGARGEGEAFGDAYELPNLRAYGESCAAIGNMMWNWRMLAVTGEGRFTDVIERALYNGINSGMSLNGTLYCYRNPLEFPGEGERPIRNPWYDTTCCPPNLERILAALPGYLYSTSDDGIYLHLFQNSELDWKLENGTGLKVTQKTNYPWDGDVEITVSPAQSAEFTFHLRVPAWSSSSQVTVNGQPVRGSIKPGEYLPIHRRWSGGDKIRLQLDMTPRLIVSNPRLVDNTDRVAVQRGPIVYCAEGLDQTGVKSLADVRLVVGKDPAKDFRIESKPDMLGGIVTVRYPAIAYDKPLSQEPLYQVLGKTQPRTSRPVSLTLIPYYAWSNREPTAMQVWMPYVQKNE